MNFKRSFYLLLAFYVGNSFSAIENYSLDFLKCFHKLKVLNKVEYNLNCSLSELQTQLQNSKDQLKHYGKRYFIAKLLKEDFQWKKNKSNAQSIQKKSQSRRDYFIFKSDMDEDSASRYFFPENRVDIKSSEKLVNGSDELKEVGKKYLELSYFLLKPLIEDKKNPYLKASAVELYFNFLGETRYFEELKLFLKKHDKIFTENKTRRHRIIQKLAYWRKNFAAYPVQTWLEEKLQEFKGEKISGKSEEELNYWLAHLVVLEKPISTDHKKHIDATARQLYVAFPKKTHALKIDQLLAYFGIEKNFQRPSLTNMSTEELFLKVESFIHYLDGRSAANVIGAIHGRMLEKKLNREAAWKAFKLHVKVLRLLDERSKIPPLIPIYNQHARFLSPNKNPSANDLDRMLMVAGYHWTYGDYKDALDILTNVETLNKRLNRGKEARVAFTRARIFEQNRSKSEAIQKITQALDFKKMKRSRRLDLKWRRFFLEYESSKSFSSYQKIYSLIEDLEKESRASHDYYKWSFWKAKTYYNAGEKTKARSFFRKLYAEAPFNYYGNLAAFAIKELTGQFPRNWKQVEPQKKTLKLDFSKYLHKNGQPKEKSFEDLAISLALLRSQDEFAKESLRSFSSSERKYLRNKKISTAKRIEFAKLATEFKLQAGENMGALRSAEAMKMRFGDLLKDGYWQYIYPKAYWEIIQSNAAKMKIDPWVIVGLIRQESAFNPKARSFASALGLMQMIPTTARKEAKLMKIKHFEMESLYEPENAIALGTHHLHGLLEKFDSSYICSFAAYNAGRPPVLSWLEYYSKSSPLIFSERISYKETRNYVKILIRNYMNYFRLYGSGELKLEKLFKMPNTTREFKSVLKDSI